MQAKALLNLAVIGIASAVCSLYTDGGLVPTNIGAVYCRLWHYPHNYIPVIVNLSKPSIYHGEVVRWSIQDTKFKLLQI